MKGDKVKKSDLLIAALKEKGELSTIDIRKILNIKPDRLWDIITDLTFAAPIYEYKINNVLHFKLLEK